MAQLTARKLQLAYERRVVVEDLDLTLPEGKVTMIVGANGSGKSTLLRGLSRLLPPRQGSVLLDGADIHSLRGKELARRLGLLPQSPLAPDGVTVRELVTRGRYPHQGLFPQWSDEDEQAVAEALALTRTDELADRLLDELSGGQRQRVWIAMALAQRTDDDERADAVELARRKLPSGPALQAQLADREAKQKLIRRMVSALARKGYAPGLAFEVVRGVLDDHGTGDDGLLEEPESL